MMGTALIIEDIPDTLRWLVAVVQAGFPGVSVDTAQSVASAMQKCDVGYPDLALVDLGLPDGEGIEIIRRLNRESPATWCVVSTIFDDDRHLFAALQAGAQGYMLKDQPKEALVTMLHGITTGQPPLSPAIARRLLEHFRPPTEPPKGDTHLSARELDVLRLIAKGYSTARTAALLGITYNTTSSYIKDVYRKLNIGTRAEATLEATRRGLIYPDTR